MKILVLLLVSMTLLVGCGRPDLNNPDLNNPDNLNMILEKAIVKEKLQKRGKVDEQLAYVPNDQKPYTGWVKEMYENGQVKVLWQYKNGIVDGLHVTWYENGQKDRESNYKEGKKNGLRTMWYENGQKKQEANWKAGNKHGSDTEWNEDGILMRETNWRDGKRVE